MSQSANTKEALQRKRKVNLTTNISDPDRKSTRSNLLVSEYEGGDVGAEEEFKARFISDVNIETKLANKVIKAAAYHSEVLA